MSTHARPAAPSAPGLRWVRPSLGQQCAGQSTVPCMATSSETLLLHTCIDGSCLTSASDLNNGTRAHTTCCVNKVVKVLLLAARCVPCKISRVHLPALNATAVCISSFLLPSTYKVRSPPSLLGCFVSSRRRNSAQNSSGAILKMKKNGVLGETAWNMRARQRRS